MERPKSDAEALAEEMIRVIFKPVMAGDDLTEESVLDMADRIADWMRANGLTHEAPAVYDRLRVTAGLLRSMSRDQVRRAGRQPPGDDDPDAEAGA